MNKIVKDINKYYLDLLIKEEKVYYEIVEDQILLSDSHMISILNRNEFFLNINLLKEVDLKRFLDNLELDQYVNIKSFYPNKDKTYVLFNDSQEVLIDKKYLKLYELLNIKINADMKPVLFYEKDFLRAFVLPIKRY